MPDPTLLALVIDDPLAPRVLAYWKACKLVLAQRTEMTPKIASMVQATSVRDVELTLDRCMLAGLLVDGGISPVAEGWLSNHVGSHLSGFNKRGKK